MLIEPLNYVIQELRTAATSVAIEGLTELISYLLHQRKIIIPKLSIKLMKEQLNSFPREVENPGIRAVSNRHDVAYAFTYLVGHPQAPTLLSPPSVRFG